MRQLVAALPARPQASPTLVDGPLRERADEVLGAGVLTWVSELAEVCAARVVERNPHRPVHVEGVVRGGQEALLAILLELVGHPVDPRLVQAPGPELTRHLVAYEVPLVEIISTIRSNMTFYIERLVAHAVSTRARQDLQLTIVVVATQWMDRVLDDQISGYLAEQERVRQGNATQRRRMVEDLVRGRAVDPDRVRERLAVNLHDEHVALVLSCEDRGPSGLERLQLAAARAARALGAPALLRHQHAPGELWLWGSGPRAPGPAELLCSPLGGDRVRIGVGSPHPGAAGFRRSHLEALDAARVARLGGRGSVVLHRDVALAVLLSHDQERALWFVESHLGALGEAGEVARELRDTLDCYYRSQMRMVTASAELGVHRNTMIHRLRRIEDLLGHPVGEQVPEVICAMRILDLMAEPPPNR